MSKNKYPSMFVKPNVKKNDYCVYYPLNIFRDADIPQFSAEDIQSCYAFRPIACERKYLMDYKYLYLMVQSLNWPVRLTKT